MISTLLNYRLYTNNLAQTLDRLESQSQVEKARSYYDANIGKVASVDEFLGDYKLYSYAMTAYGLEDQIGSKGFMRKVLESDLSDVNSFANKLVDKRYREFAGAFSFGAATAPVVQTASQRDLVVEAYGERVSRSAPIAARAAGQLEAAIGRATSLADIAADRPALEVAMRAVGIGDPSRISTDYVRSVLDGTAATPLPAEFAALKARLTAALPGTAGADKARGELVYDYYLATGNATSPQAAQGNLDHFKSVMANQGAITRIEDLTGDRRVLAVMTAGVGMTETFTSDYIAGMIRSQSNIDALAVTDAQGQFLPAQAAIKAQFQALHDLFRFDVPGGYQPGATVLSAENLEKVADGYLRNYKAAQIRADGRATAVFEAEMSRVKTLGDLLRVDADPLTGLTYNPETGQANSTRTKLDYLLRAFDIDPATVSLTQIRAVLTSDPSDPQSYVSRLRDERFSKLAAAFNFDETGQLRAERRIQDMAGQTETARLYAASFGADQSEAQKSLVKAAAERYLESVQSIHSIEGFLADRDAVAFALTAYGVKDKTIGASELRRILTSDLADPKSVANAHPDKAVAKFAAAFNFETDGSIAAGANGVQGAAARRTTDSLYLLQTLETQAGEVSEGTRLALYFLRKGPEITSSFAILADKALFEVVRTALGLPAGMASMDIEKQAALLDRRLDTADFADPAKLDKFIGRFAALYDLSADTGSSSPILQLFGGGNGGGGIASLFG